MNAYNSLQSVKRLEAAGIDRRHAEAIASEITESTDEVVTKEYFKEHLDAAMDRVTIRICAIIGGIVTIACTVLGVVLAH